MKEIFKKEVLNHAKDLTNIYPWRLGQAVFNYIDGVYGIARTLQFKYNIDCFYNDSEIESFIDKAYELVKFEFDKTVDEYHNNTPEE